MPPPGKKKRRIGSYYVDRAPSVYSEEASIVAEVLACDLETLQITFVEVDTTIQRQVDPLTYFQDPPSLIIVKTFLEEQTEKNVRLQQWMDDLKARIHLCQEQQRFSQESEIVCIDEDADADDDEDEPKKSTIDIDDSREYICIEIDENDEKDDDDEEDETLVDKEDDQQEEPKEEKPPKSKSKSNKSSFKVYMPTRDEMAFCCADCRCETATSIHTIQNGDDSLYHRLCCHKIANNNANAHVNVFKKAGLWRCPVQLVDEQRTAALTATSHKHTYDHQGNILFSNRELGRRLVRYQKEEERLLRVSNFELQRKVNTNQRQQQAFTNADFEARKYLY
jgi:hypothetical protein